MQAALTPRGDQQSFLIHLSPAVMSGRLNAVAPVTAMASANQAPRSFGDARPR